MKKETVIRIETLQLITDPKTFFEADKFLSVDVFDIAEMPISSLEKLKLRNNGKAFDYAGRTYMPILLKGSPENLFLNTKNGLPCQIGNINVLLYFDGKLSEIIAQKKVYDISNCYKKKEFNFRADTDFLINRYVLPYVMGAVTSHKPKVLFPGNILSEVAI